MISLSLDETIRAVFGIQSVGMLISTAELIATGELLETHGLHSARQFMETPGVWQNRFVHKGLISLATWVRVLGSLALLIAAVSGMSLLLPLILLLLASLYISWVKKVGGDGADQMSLISLAAALPVLVLEQETGKHLFLVFLALQACLAYVTAGVAKVISPVWRSGDAIGRIVQTSNYGNAWSERLFQNSHVAGFIVCWSLMIWEIVFPLCLLGFEPLTIGILLVGCLFHIACAITMGLNDFFWAFAGTYPAVLFVAKNGFVASS